MVIQVADTPLRLHTAIRNVPASMFKSSILAEIEHKIALTHTLRTHLGQRAAINQPMSKLGTSINVRVLDYILIY